MISRPRAPATILTPVVSRLVRPRRRSVWRRWLAGCCGDAPPRDGRRARCSLPSFVGRGLLTRAEHTRRLPGLTHNAIPRRAQATLWRSCASDPTRRARHPSFARWPAMFSRAWWARCGRPSATRRRPLCERPCPPRCATRRRTYALPWCVRPPAVENTAAHPVDRSQVTILRYPNAAHQCARGACRARVPAKRRLPTAPSRVEPSACGACCARRRTLRGGRAGHARRQRHAAPPL